MTSQITVNSTLSSLAAKQAEKKKLHGKGLANTADTLSSAKASKGEKKGFAKAPTLQVPAKKPANSEEQALYLRELASALEAGFLAMAKTAENQVLEETNMQELDQSMSKQVLLQSTASIKQEQNEAHLVHKIQHEEKHKSFIARISGDISTLGLSELLRAAGVHGITANIIIGVAMVAIAGALILATWGGATPVVAEELGEDAMVTGEIAAQLGSDGEDAIPLTNVGEFSDTSSMTDASDFSDVSDVSEDEGLEDIDLNEANEEDNTLRQANRDVDNDGNAQSREISEKAKKLAWKAAKKLGHMVIGAIWGIPMILQGSANIIIAGYKKQLADAQDSVGTQMGTLKINEGYFKFYQQLLQRGTTLAKDTGSQMSDIVQVFGEITNAYKQMANLLANQSA